MPVSPDAAPLAMASPAAAAAANGVDEKEFSLKIQISSPNRFRRHRCRCLVCCGACAALAAAAAVVIIIVALTVYRVREPVMTMNSVAVQNLDLQASPSSAGGGALAANITVAADVSVKNPNAATFEYGPSATAVYYRGREVGEAWGPPGTARARRTVRMNVSVDVMAGRVAADPAFLADVAAGSVGVSTSTRVGGRVRVLGLLRRHVDLVMNCSFAVAVPAMAVQNQSCWQHVSL